MESKKIRNFKQFLHQQRQKRINEAKVNIECEWWDACIVEVMQEIEDECQGFMVWETIINYCKSKWSILGKELPIPVSEDNLLLQHIKDLIFQFHGKSFYTDWKCDMGWDNAQVHSKGLVIEELAAVILAKVREKTKPEGEPDTGETTGTLSDREEIKMVPMKPAPVYDDCEDEYCEDLPYESHKVKPVKGFSDYTKMLKESAASAAIISCSCKDDCISYCMDRIKQEVGSYDPDGILIKAAQTADPRVRARVILLYAKHMVIDYMNKEKVQLDVVNLKGKKEKNIPDDVLEQGLDTLFHEIADEVLEKIANENGVYYAEAESD